jgi:hypothetical protein
VFISPVVFIGVINVIYLFKESAFGFVDVCMVLLSLFH